MTGKISFSILLLLVIFNGVLFGAAQQQGKLSSAESENWKKQIKGYTLIITDCKSYDEAASAVDYIKKLGGEIAVIGSKNAFLGWISPGLTYQLIGQKGITAVYYNPLDVNMFNAADRQTLQTIIYFNSVVSGKLEKQLEAGKAEPQIKKDYFDGLPRPQISKEDYLKNLQNKNVDLNALQNTGKLLKSGAGETMLSGNSDKMVGTVAVAVFMVESNGAIEQNQYTWTTADEDSIYQRTVRDLSWWAGMARNYGKSLTFNVIPHYHSDPVCQQPYEPINHSSFEDSLWIGAIMKNAGYQSGRYYTRVEAYNTSLRSAFHTDWAYSIFFAYNPWPAPHSFKNGYGGYACTGGPYTQILFTWFPNGTPTVAHETGHIFRAPDEYYVAGYGGCSDGASDTFSGFKNGNCEVSNTNSVDCMMKRNSFVLCAYTPAHLGWVDNVPHYFLRTNPVGLLVFKHENSSPFPGKQQISPQEYPWGQGLSVNISVASPQILNGVKYEFQSWSDGGAQSHNITIPVNSTDYIANFRPVTESPQTWSLYQSAAGLGSLLAIRSVITDIKGNIWVGSYYGLFKYDGENWTNYNTSNSAIPSNQIKYLTSDSAGNLWVLFYSYFKGSQDFDYGIAKYDGSTWRLYNKENSGLPTNFIQTMAVDKANNVWIGTYYGLTKYDGVNWVTFPPSKSGLPYYNIYAITFDSFGNKWIASSNKLIKYDDVTWTVYTSDAIMPEEYIRDIAIDEQGNKWIAAGNKLVKFDDTNWIIYRPLQSPQSQVQVVRVDLLGNIWLGSSRDGVIVFDGISWKRFSNSNSILPNNPVIAITQEASGKMCIGTNDGLVRSDGKEIIPFVFSGNNLQSNNVKAVAIDGDNNKWIGTNDAGLAKFDDAQWIIYNTSNSSLPTNMIYALACDKSKNMWVGTPLGLARFDGTNWTVYTSSNSGLPHSWVFSIFVDSLGNKWIGTYNGLAKYDDSNWTVYNSSNSPLPDKEILCIVAEPSGIIWIGTNGKGLIKFDGSTWSVYNTSNSRIPSNYIFALAVNANGVKWMGSDKGLIKFSGNDNWVIYNRNNSLLPDNKVGTIVIDQAGIMWVGTNDSYVEGGGMVKIAGENWTVYNNLNSGLPYGHVSAIAIDALGNKWIGTSGGGMAIFNDGGLPALQTPVKTKLHQPETGISEQPKSFIFKWNNVKSTKKYFLTISSHPAFYSIIKCDSTVFDTTKIVYDLKEGEKYYWKVYAKNSSGVGPCSDVWSFTTRVTAPTNLTLERTALKEVTLRWKDNSNNVKGWIIERKQLPQNDCVLLDSLKTPLTSYRDNKVEQGKNYSYRIKAYTNSVQSSYSGEISMLVTGVEKNTLPVEYSLYQNYPNPFNPTTKIKFALPEKAMTNVVIYDVLGREVAELINCEMDAGYHEILFNAGQFSSGVYLYRIVTPKFTSTKKLVLLK